jgi:hypothetical protein
MAGYRAIAAVGRSITAILNQGFVDAIPAGRRPRAVLAGTSDFESVVDPPSVIVYCYRLTVDKETRPGWSSVASVDGIPRIPLQMHMMMSAWDTSVESELEWLGLTARILEGTSILTGPQLDRTGAWDPGDAIQVVSEDIPLDSMSEAFQALTTDYRCCLPYLARIIVIEANQKAVGEPVTTVGSDIEPIGAER